MVIDIVDTSSLKTSFKHDYDTATESQKITCMFQYKFGHDWEPVGGFLDHTSMFRIETFRKESVMYEAFIYNKELFTRQVGSTRQGE